MRTSIEFDAKKLDRRLDKLLREMPAAVDKALIQTSQFGTNLILDRTERGVGYEGKFKPYTPEYVKRKGQGWSSTNRTRGFGGAPTSPVNLMLRGEMLGEMTSKKVKTGVARIYFTRSTEAKKAAFNNKTRPFFGFNVSEQNKLRNFFANRFKL